MHCILDSLYFRLCGYLLTSKYEVKLLVTCHYIHLHTNLLQPYHICLTLLETLKTNKLKRHTEIQK